MNSPLWIDIILYGSVFSAVVPLLFFKGAIEYPFRWAFVLVCLSFSADLCFSIIFLHVDNVKAFHLYGIVEALVVTTFYYHVLGKRKWVKYLFSGFAICYIVDALFVEPDQFNAIGSSLEALMIIFLSLRLFFQFFSEEEEVFLDKSPVFWINIAFLVYFSGALFSFILSTDILSQSRDRFYTSWALNNISNFLKNVLLAIGFWKIKWK
ncbi:MAG: hypothetical protein HWE21_16505 [Cytophagia bacterium]|nr:hypothetical protein [Cytophagia bacterium]NVK85930.1 hypothetical protein [Cytophagia bacterium]